MVQPQEEKGEEAVSTQNGEDKEKFRKRRVVPGKRFSWERSRTFIVSPPPRPRTMTLDRPTPNLNHPEICRRRRRRRSRGRTESVPEVNSVAENSPPLAIDVAPGLLPEPCRSCERPAAPERLHGHRRPVLPPPSSPLASKDASPLSRSEAEENPPLRFKDRSQTATLDSPSVMVDRALTATPLDSPVRLGPKSAYLCYLCGRPFGSKSLPLHEPHCLERWKRENASLPPEERRPLPRRPDCPSREEWNEASWRTFQSNLVPCPHCSRTFFPERLKVHARICGGESGDSPPPPSPSIPLRPILAKSPLVPCYICGRPFGSKSISLHEPHCLRRWRQENDQLNPALRRPEPRRPHPRGTAELDLHALSEDAWKSHLAQLVPCSKCSRTFNPERLPIHLKSCAGPPAKK